VVNAILDEKRDAALLRAQIAHAARAAAR